MICKLLRFCGPSPFPLSYRRRRRCALPCCFFLGGRRGTVVLGIDFEEVVEDNEEHGEAAKENRKGVEIVV